MSFRAERGIDSKSPTPIDVPLARRPRVQRGDAGRKPLEALVDNAWCVETKILDKESQPLEYGPVRELICSGDQILGVVLIEVFLENLGAMPRAAAESWIVQHLYDRPCRTRESQAHVAQPFARQSPGHFVAGDVAYCVVVVE